MYYVIAGLIISLVLIVLTMPAATYFVHYVWWQATMSTPVESGNVQDGRLEIHFVVYGERSGDDVPIVLLHGGLSNKFCWFSQLPTLAKAGRQLILLDTRGHGASTQGESQLKYDHYAEDVLNVLDKLHIGSADMIGWSDGGNTALLLGHNYPQRVNRIVAISANTNPEGLTEEAKKGNKVPYSWLKQQWNQFFTRADDYPRLERRIKKLWSIGPQISRPMLQAIHRPVLLIQGEYDYITIDHAKSIQHSLPDAELKIIAGGGHSTLFTHAQQVNDLITQFLKINETNHDE